MSASQETEEIEPEQRRGDTKNKAGLHRNIPRKPKAKSLSEEETGRAAMGNRGTWKAVWHTKEERALYKQH